MYVNIKLEAGFGQKEHHFTIIALHSGRIDVYAPMIDQGPPSLIGVHIDVVIVYAGVILQQPLITMHLTPLYTRFQIPMSIFIPVAQPDMTTNRIEYVYMYNVECELCRCYNEVYSIWTLIF